MSALSFLGGLSGAYTAVEKGRRDAEDRDALLRDREYQKQQREYQTGQQKRMLDEQARDDQFRDGLAGVQTTEQASLPAEGTVYDNPSAVMRDDEGNLMPGAVETKPAQTVSRPRNRDDIMADYAEIARKAGKMDQALKFDEQAAAESMKRGRALFSQWSASTPDTANLENAIKQAAQIYNGDRLPGQVQGYKMNPDGSATVNIKNTATGQAIPVTFKNVAELKQGLEGYYSQETLDAHRKSLRESAIKRQEKEFEFKNDPSKRFQKFSANQTVFDAATGKIVQQGVKAGGQPIYDEDGNITGYTGGGGAGSGAKQPKGKDPLAVTTSAVMDAIKESAESKSLSADQLIGVQAAARELVANASRSGQEIDPYVAGKLALTAVLKPESVKPSFNKNTGALESTLAYNGNRFSIGLLSPNDLPESQLQLVAQNYVSGLPRDERDLYIGAARGDKAAIDAINSQLSGDIKQWAANFKAATGRNPTQQEANAKLQSSSRIAESRIDMVLKSGAVEQDKKQRDTAAKNQATAAAKAAIGTPQQIMALPPGKAAQIYRQYGGQTDAFQREALKRKINQDRLSSMTVGGLRPQ